VSVARDLGVRTYHFYYFGDHRDAVETAVTQWCVHNQCRLQITRLLEGDRFQVIGPEDVMRAVYRLARQWVQLR